MAPNSSSVFNEAPTETKPSSAPAEPLTSASPDTRPVATPSSSISTATDCSGKQVAPKMEQHMDDLPASSTPTDASDVAAALRFGHMAPASDLDDAKKTMVFRKSCLKRQSSFLPSSLDDIHADAIKIENVEIVSASLEDESKKEPAAPVQKNRRRCWECKAKVGLTAVTCRCDFTFCNKHRYAEEHSCRYNFKGAAKRKLEDENPRVVPSKVARIN